MIYSIKIVVLSVVVIFSLVGISISGVKDDAADLASYCKSISKDKNQFFSCLEKKSDDASPELNHAIAALFYKKGDVDKAIVFLKRAAEKDYIEAKMELFRIYFKKGPHHDCNKCIFWLKEAIDDGSDIARVRLANIYIFDKCDVGSPEQAYEIILPAAKNGNAVAQLTVGLMFKDGVGVAPDKEEASFWLKAAEQNEDPKVGKVAREALSQL